MPRGVFAHKGEEYTWDVKAQFKDTDGTGTRNEGLGIVGRPCTFVFEKQQAPTLVARPLADPVRNSSLVLASLRGRALGPMAQEFAEHCRSLFGHSQTHL